ncbi:MAG: protein kinase [Planctomycetes bacterium]|nr:protein kinase [Planctomycetota bacterium]
MGDYPRDFGNYTLLAELGRGGMGVVYRAEQKSLGRPVALKVLNVARDWAGEQTLARFQREGEVMARLAHPDIVAVHDFGVHEERVYIAMELVRGMSLDRYVRSSLPGLEASLEIVARMARALHHAHQNGIVHRDVKPSNILIDAEDHPKLTDFGLAKVEGRRLSLSGGLLGTPVYMSPEQAAGDPVDARSDVYGLGAVLYELLTGGPPFAGTSVEAIVHQVVHAEPAPPRLFNVKIPPDVETICLKAMEKQRDRRYATALAMAEDVERFLRGESILARRTGAAERAWKWARRRRGVVAAAGLALILVGAGGAVAWRLSSRLREKEKLDALAAEADGHYRRGSYADALAAYARLPDGPDVRLRRAICLRETGRREEAEREFAAHVAAFPGDASAWRHRGLNALERDDLPAAVAHYRAAARLAKVPLADEADRFGDYDVVAALVERHFAVLEPQHARADLASCSPHYHFGRRNEFERLLQTELPDSYSVLAEWAERFPIPSYRDVDLDTWLRKYGEHPVLLGWRASANLERDPAAALADANRAIAAVPVSRWLRYLRFRARFALGRRDDAAREADAIAILCPWDTYVRWNIAHCRRKKGDFLRAARDFEMLTEADRKGRAPDASPGRLFMSAARCAARGDAAAETVRLLRAAQAAGEPPLRDPGRDPDFAPVFSSFEFQEYLDSFDPLMSAFHKGTTKEFLPDPWAGCAIGSWARYRMVLDAKGTARTLDVVVHLGRNDERTFTMSTTFTDGPRQGQISLFPDVPRRGAPELADPESGEEAVRVPKGDFRCRWARPSVPGGSVQVWWSDEVPFRVVKRIYRTPNRTATVELVDFEKK